MLSRVATAARRTVNVQSRRVFSVQATQAREQAGHRSLSEHVAALVPKLRADYKELKATYGSKSLGDVKVEQVLGGMRGMTGLLTETSLLDAEEGIRFRGHTIPDLQKSLPKAPGGNEPLPEGLLWLLLTGDVPTDAQVRELTADLHKRSALPEHVKTLIDAFPQNLHPMSALVSAVAALQSESKFAAAYQRGVNKTTYWSAHTIAHTTAYRHSLGTSLGIIRIASIQQAQSDTSLLLFFVLSVLGSTLWRTLWT